ncbi:VanZ family protein [Kaarinaea lacus]
MSFSHSYKTLHWFPLWLFLGISLVVAVIYLSLTAKPPMVVSFAFSDKIAHFLAYAVLMGWFGQIFSGRLPLVLFAFGFALMGISLEYVQGMGHHRHFEYADMIANTIGVVLGLLLTTTVFRGSLHWIERQVLSGRIKT